MKDNYYVWEELYETAILETDDKKLPDCLQAAKVAINSRLQEIQADGRAHLKSYRLSPMCFMV